MGQFDGAFFHRRDAAALQRRRDAAKRTDGRKLDRLRAQHTRRHAAVLGLQREALEAATDRNAHRSAIGCSPTIDAFLARPVAEIVNAAADELEAAGIRDFAAFDLWLMACQRLASLQQQMAPAAEAFRASCALMSRLEAYVTEQSR